MAINPDKCQRDVIQSYLLIFYTTSHHPIYTSKPNHYPPNLFAVYHTEKAIHQTRLIPSAKHLSLKIALPEFRIFT